MQPAYSLSLDKTGTMICLTMSGFFQADDVARLAEHRLTFHDQLRCPPNDHTTLVDLREMQIQPQTSVEAFTAMLSVPRTRSRRIAFVVSRSLARLQAKRASAGREAQFFLTLEDAQAWLSERD